ncbi:MAG: mandelate racemase/muconate lactonizing enzyme family protein [Actinobacteria bacterium]|nr:mandelate racemase/muconate lactonizing enzyme family protein [Actinomycetota bacterium]
MRITELETIVIEDPRGMRVIRDSIHTVATGRELIVRLHTDAGVYGTHALSIAAYGGELTRQLFEVEMRKLVVGQDAALPRRLRRHLFDQMEYYGTAGLGIFGISIIDYCVWDILGKAAGRTVAQLLGQYQTEIPAYGMVGWLNLSIPELVDRCKQTCGNGYRAVKIKVGAPELSEDLRRIEAVREAVGPGVHIMVDANQVFSLAEAIRRGQAYAPYDLFWFEEPLRPWMKDAYAQLKAAVPIPIATGENDYLKFPFKDLLTRGGVDILQPDARRAGGVTEIMEIAALAEAFGARIATHGGWQHNCQLLAAMPNGIYLEASGSTRDERWVEPVEIVDGLVQVPDRPGFGLEYREDWLAKAAVDGSRRLG